MKYIFTLIFFCFSLLLCSQTLRQYDFEVQKMGTQFRIIFFAENDAIADQVSKKAFARIDELNLIFSDYDSQSEVSRISSFPEPDKPVKLSNELHYVLSLSQFLSEKSNGAFDVTIGPLSKLWRRAIRRQTFPGNDLVEEKRALVDYQNIQLLEDHHVVFLSADMKLDFGGIAKGYTVDEVYKSLLASGIDYALVDGGGDIYAGEHPTNPLGWKVKQSDETIYLHNEAIASSGGTFKFIVHNGKTYCHIIDPRTGFGIPKVEPVFIRASSCTLADALASIASIEGEKVANEIKESIEIAAWTSIYNEKYQIDPIGVVKNK